MNTDFSKMGTDELVALYKKIEREQASYNLLQNTKKVCLNSAYGSLAQPGFRWFMVANAEAITLSGQFAIKWTVKKINAFLNDMFKTKGVDYVIYIDTDSLYLTLDRFVELFRKKRPDASNEQIVDKLDEFVEKILQPEFSRILEQHKNVMNAYEQKLHLKREYIAEKGIWVAKKRYILDVWDVEGVRYHSPKLKITGLETQRSTTPKICKEKLKEAFSIVVKEDRTALFNFIEKFYKEFSNLSVDEIAEPKGVNGLSEYADSSTIWRLGCPGHVKAALIFNKVIKDRGLEKLYPPIKEGEKIKIVQLKEPNPIGFPVIAFNGFFPREMELENYIDRDLMFDKTFMKPLSAVVECVGWSMKEETTLDDFF